MWRGDAVALLRHLRTLLLRHLLALQRHLLALQRHLVALQRHLLALQRHLRALLLRHLLALQRHLRALLLRHLLALPLGSATTKQAMISWYQLWKPNTAIVTITKQRLTNGGVSLQ
jgi:hypothetical protein